MTIQNSSCIESSQADSILLKVGVQFTTALELEMENQHQALKAPSGWLGILLWISLQKFVLSEVDYYIVDDNNLQK